MTLRLVIEHSTHPQPVREMRHLGGDLSIGRGTDCDWPIDDPDMFISRRHCVVSGRDGQFQVTDASRGGLFIDGADRPLGAGNSAPLEHGMRIRLGDVVIRVEIEGASERAPAAAAARPDDFFSRPVEAPAARPRPESLPEPFETGRPAQGIAAPPQRPASPAFDDPFTLDPVASPAPGQPNPARRAEPAPLSAEAFWSDAPRATPPPPTPPAASGFGFGDPFAPASPPAAAQPATEPAPTFDWPAPEPAPATAPPPPASTPEVAAQPAPPPQPPAPTDPGAGAWLAAFLKGAGLDAQGLTVAGGIDEMEDLGRRFRLLAEGLVGLLRTRAKEKGSARLAQTVIGSVDVNPLKFLPTTDEAVAALIAPRGKGYLAPEDAINGAFRDITDHQMRSWIAIQSALRRMIDRFDPAALEVEADKEGLMKALLAGGKSAKLWQLYAERYREIAKSAEDRFLGEVGADFRDAYEGTKKQQEDER